MRSQHSPTRTDIRHQAVCSDDPENLERSPTQTDPPVNSARLKLLQSEFREGEIYRSSSVSKHTKLNKRRVGREQAVRVFKADKFSWTLTFWLGRLSASLKYYLNRISSDRIDNDNIRNNTSYNLYGLYCFTMSNNAIFKFLYWSGCVLKERDASKDVRSPGQKKSLIIQKHIQLIQTSNYF